MEYRKFKVADVFNIKCSKYYNPKKYKEGKIPYIARTTFNNGVVDLIETNETLYSANCITIGAESAKAFYQKKPFITGNKIYRLYLKEKYNFILNEKVALYFCSLLNKIGEKYDYTNAFISSRIESEILNLPTTNKQIDFEFMDNYIKNIEIKMRTLISSYSLLVAASRERERERERENKPRSDFSLIFSKNSHISSLIKEAIIQMAKSLFDKLGVKWGEFRLVDLFDYERGSRLTKNNRKSGIYPLITAGETNLGVKEFISNKNQKIFNNAITIDMFCNSFVHIKDFCCDDNVLVLTSKTKVSTEVMHFISAIIHKSKDKFGYGQQYRQNTLEKHVIYLPLDEFSNPNFTLMENFIKEIKQNHTQKLIDYYLRLADIAK